jgi:hypothetical protein
MATSPARIVYDDLAARRRQLSSGPLGRLISLTQKLIMNINHIAPSILLLLVVGCSTFESEDSSEMQLSVQRNSEVLRRAINLEIAAPGWRKTLTGADFVAPGAPNHTQPFTTPKSGKLQVQFTLTDSTGDHLSSGVVSLDIRADWRWSVDFVLSSQNPFNGCFGCLGYTSFPLDSVFQKGVRDSLYVIWGGNSIKHPVIY